MTHSPQWAQAPWWLPGGHAQTIWPAFFSRWHEGPPPRYRRERWTTPDGDFVDADWLLEVPAASQVVGRPLLVLFHGLEGSSGSRYAQSFAAWARYAGWAYVVPHFRGCSGEINHLPRAYHSGDFQEIDWMLAQAAAAHDGPVVAVGVSLGGNALLRWAQEAGQGAAQRVRALAAICSPVDLAAGGHAIARGLGRWTYTPMFLRSMKPKAWAKLAQYPGLFDAQRLRQARTLYEFDQVFTAPLHGFKGTDDYWSRASAKPRLREVRLPALLINPRNDPFVPARSLPTQHDVSGHVTLWQPGSGGHVGFASGGFPGTCHPMTEAVMDWLCAHL
jgi:predicted alpha/beta-fold hydrolase